MAKSGQGTQEAGQNCAIPAKKVQSRTGMASGRTRARRHFVGYPMRCIASTDKVHAESGAPSVIHTGA